MSAEPSYNLSWVNTDVWTNSTTPDPFGVLNDTWTLDQANWHMVGLGIIPLWILTGNLLVLLAVCRNRALRTLSNWVIASLALTDFLLAVFVVPLGVYQTVTGRWDLGLVVCLVWTGSDVFLSTTSILHLCAIAIHRYHGIKNPLKVRSVLDKRYVAKLIIPTWTVSFAITLPLVIQGAMDTHHVLLGDDSVGYSCGIFHRTFAVYSSLVSFFIPLAVMVFADIRSIQILRKHVKFPLRQEEESRDKHKNRRQQQQNSAPAARNGRGRYSNPSSGMYDISESTETTTATVLTPMVEYSRTGGNGGAGDSNATAEQTLTFVSPQISPDVTPNRNKRFSRPPPSNQPFKGRARSKSMVYISMLASRGFVKINSRERRAERTLIWVFVCFVVLWLPFFCTNLTYGLCGTCDIPPEVFGTFSWLGYLSSGVNPCIYTFLNKDFRRAFVKIITCYQYKRDTFRTSTCA